MPTRRRQGRKTRQQRKRKRPMDFDIPPNEDGNNLHIEYPVNMEPAINRIFHWCYNKLPSMSNVISATAQVFFPFRSFEDDLEHTRAELRNTREELNEMKEKFQKLEFKFNDFSKKSNLPVRYSAIPPPPPPPPPPLPPPVVANKNNLARKPFQTLKKQNEIIKAKPCIMLEDILKVKLKKRNINCNAVDGKENKIPKTSLVLPRISLSDLTSVNLKSSQNTKKLTTELKTTPKSVLIKRKLRKTTVKRSPGGTPMITRSAAHTTGTGPTPEFTRALQRKFRSVRTSPLVENGDLASPTLKKEERTNEMLQWK